MTQPELEFDGGAELIGEPDIARSLDAAEGEPEGVPAPTAATPCQFVTGRAGTGKTTWAKKQIEGNVEWGMLCATTGVAAMNLDTVTLNATLGYFDTDSLRDAYLNGRLVRRLHEIALSHRRLVIDEVSMMDAQQL